MKKNIICLTIACAMAIGVNNYALANGITATPNNASVAVDSKPIEIGAYNIGGYNYFKLRDIAAALNGTGSNFEVGYDADAKCISLTTDKAYTVAGGELGEKPTAEKTAEVSNQKIMLNGKDVTMQAYVIDGYNYFQLRELGTNLGFDVTWDDTAKAINMVTKEAVVEEEPKILDLTGTWTQKDAEEGSTFHEAVITEDTITINWVNIYEETRALYWAGTFDTPKDDKEPYNWISENDKSQTDRALLASGADTKSFKYKDGEITYEAAALGVTKVIHLVKAK